VAIASLKIIDPPEERRTGLTVVEPAVDRRRAARYARPTVMVSAEA